MDVYWSPLHSVTHHAGPGWDSGTLEAWQGEGIRQVYSHQISFSRKPTVGLWTAHSWQLKSCFP